MTELFFTSEKVKKAYQLASELFANKTDLASKPYIEHLERVGVEAVKKFSNWAYLQEPVTAIKQDFEDVYCAALLKDVLDYTIYGVEEIKTNFNFRVASLITLFSTSCIHLEYKDYIELIGNNSLAIFIKLAELEDNMDIRKLNTPLKENDLKKLKKYHDSWLYLTQKLKEI